MSEDTNAAEHPTDSAASLRDAPEPQPAHDTALPAAPRRQSLVLRSGVCDMRVGADALDRLGQDLHQTAGTSRSTLLVAADDVDRELQERVRRSLVDAGFSVSQTSVPAGRAARSLEAASGLYASLGDVGVNADDAIVVIGDADVVSLAVFVSSTWCGGCALAAVPTTLDATVDAAITPRALDLSGARDAVQARGNVRLLVCDLAACDFAAPCEGTLMGRAVMVASAVAAGERQFSELALWADGIVAGSRETLLDAVLGLTKARCRSAASSVLAIRQGVAYGRDLARALRECLPVEGPDAVGDAVLLGEGLRISARLAAGYQGPETDLVGLVLAQDALLTTFGLGEVPCEVRPDDLVAALRSTALRHSNRLMPALPLDYGRVRLTSVSDELLNEHLRAWCRARQRLAQRLAGTTEHD